MNVVAEPVLAIDTSIARASVALWSSGVVHEAHIEGTSLQAQSVLPMIDDLLKTAGLTPMQLGSIVFGRGPGSFTGLRIACSIAKGLAYAHDLPLYSVSDLALIAHQLLQKKGSFPVLSLMDARMDQLYWAYYPNQESLVSAQEYVTSAADVDCLTDSPFYLAGIGFEPYQTAISSRILEAAIDAVVIEPSASGLISMIQSIEMPTVDVQDAAPVYIRQHVTHGDVNG